MPATVCAQADGSGVGSRRSPESERGGTASGPTCPDAASRYGKSLGIRTIGQLAFLTNATGMSSREARPSNTAG